MSSLPRISLYGFHPATAGAALIHWELARRLPAELGDEIEVLTVPSGPVEVSASLSRRLTTALPPGSDLTIGTSTPLPLRTGSAPLLALLYDVRWYWSRSRAARRYRLADFHRTIRRAAEVLTISNTSAAQIQMLSRMQRPVTVLPMGPGQFEGYAQPTPVDSGRVVLIGQAAHKRNELAAQLLCESTRVRESYHVVAVSVSEATKQILRSGFRSQDLSIVDAPSVAELAELFRSASAYLSLGYSEGFGFPYVEAAYFGCDVVAPDLPLTRELLGDDGNLLHTITPGVTDLETALSGWDAARITRLQQLVSGRSWGDTAHHVARVIRTYMSTEAP